MFNLFKRNKPLHKLPISKAIQKIKKMGSQNLHINIYFDDIILFQAIPAIHFREQGFICEKYDMTIVFAFGKENPDQIQTVFEKLKNNEINKNIFSFEEPKGTYFYLKNIGSDPLMIEKEIKDSIKIFELNESTKLSIEYLEY